MKLYALIIAGVNPNGNTYIYSSEYELSSLAFFSRNSIKGCFKFICRETTPLLTKGPKGARNTAEHKNTEGSYTVHIQYSYAEKLAYYAFCDSSYPKRVAFKCLNECMESFEKKYDDTWSKVCKDENLLCGLNAKMKEFSDPTKVDVVIAALKTTDEIKSILHKNIKELLERHGDLDKLLEKSIDLNTQGREMLKQSRKLDKSWWRWCCCF